MKLQFFAVVAVAALLAGCQTQRPVEDVPAGPAPVTDGSGAPTTPSGPGYQLGSSQHFAAEAGDRVFYGYDRYDLTPEARETLRRQAEWLNAYPNVTLLIAGNCDERGTREYNLALGARRANAARDYLVSLGVSPQRLSTVSYGKERPSCMQSNEQCWSVNRNATSMIQSGAVG